MHQKNGNLEWKPRQAEGLLRDFQLTAGVMSLI
jgi:hypothetical protein